MVHNTTFACTPGVAGYVPVPVVEERLCNDVGNEIIFGSLPNPSEIATANLEHPNPSEIATENLEHWRQRALK